MNLNHATNKANGSTLSASEWNNLAADVNELGAGGGSNSEYVTLTAKNNIEISSPKNINIEPASDETNDVYGDISLKPGDDIEFLSEHRPADKQDEVSLKVHDGDKKPVKLQINAAEMVLTTKDKTGDNAAVFDVTVNSAKNTRGYLKVRAQAIDLRSESHGGIALQPKGVDGQGNMNKIKFEHGGGDGLEFGTFNTEKTSIFTNEYRFNQDGVIKAVYRETEASDKADVNDPTTALKYVKQSDDFYDKTSRSMPICTWEDLVYAGSAIDFSSNESAKYWIGFSCVAEDNELTTLTSYSENSTNLQVGDYFTIADLEDVIAGNNATVTGMDVSAIAALQDAWKQNETLQFQFSNVTLGLMPVRIKFGDIARFIIWAKQNEQGPFAAAV